MTHSEHPAIIVPKVREITEALNKARARRAANVAAAEAAEAELREANQATGRIRASIATREAELASTEAPLPAEPFPEDAQLAQAERIGRVRAIRARMAREEAPKSDSEIKRLKGEIDSAWVEFGSSEHGKVLQRFNETALLLQRQFGEITALAVIFRSLHLPVPEVVISDATNVGKAFINTLDLVWNTQHPPEATDPYAALCTAKGEIERVKGGD